MRSVSIVIPNWNGADLLETHLPSVLAAADAYAGEAEVIVVDDASTDDSVALLESDFRDVQCVHHERNRGFGRACWSGAKAARHPILILLNSDVSVEPDFIAPLAEAFEAEETFAASPLILEENGLPSDVTLSIPYLRRGKIRYRDFPVQLLVEKGSEAPGPWYTLFPLGGAFAVDRERYIDLGGFDELFHPFYYEDTDLGFRAWRRGWTCRVIPSSRVTHYHRGTIARSFKRFKVLVTRKRNRILYTWKNLTTTRHFLAHIFFQLFRCVYRTLALDIYVLLSSIYSIPRLLLALRRRREEQRVAKRTEEEIFELIEEAARVNREALQSERAEMVD